LTEFKNYGMKYGTPHTAAHTIIQYTRDRGIFQPGNDSFPSFPLAKSWVYIHFLAMFCASQRLRGEEENTCLPLRGKNVKKGRAVLWI